MTDGGGKCIPLRCRSQRQTFLCDAQCVILNERKSDREGRPSGVKKQMQYDIIIVTSNSAPWLERCVQALANTDYPSEQLHLVFSDRGSTDDTRACLARLKTKYPAFGSFCILENSAATHFGAACNAAIAQGCAPAVLFLQPDAAVDTALFAELEAAQARADARTAAWECRQLPWEAAHSIDPVTMETSWASGAALLVRRTVLEEIGGWESHAIPYGEDVDLSWRMRAKGYKLCYVPGASVVRTAQEGAAPGLDAYAGGLLGELLLRYKFGSGKAIRQGHRKYLEALRHPCHFDGVRKVLAKKYLRHFGMLWPFWFWRFSHRADFAAHVGQFDGGFAPDRGLCKNETPQQTPLVSVIVRTCGRPDTLRRTLESLRWQTYKNFEILVAEDGAPTAKTMLETEFSDLPIRYLNDGVRYGRAENGNRGLAAAQGELCNFLDDDDFFYPDHLELLVSVWSRHPEADLVLGSAMAMFVTRDGTVTRLEPMVFDRIDRFTMCQDCRIPIQTVLFRRSLFTRYGGMPQELAAHEDWAMWLKYLEHARRITPHQPDVRRATSIFVQPAEKEAADARIAAYSISDAAFYGDPSLHFEVTLADMRRYYADMIRDMRCLEARGELHDFLEKQSRRE